MDPLFTFVLGLLIGWLIEWLIDYFYWRRRYAEKSTEYGDDAVQANRNLTFAVEPESGAKQP